MIGAGVFSAFAPGRGCRRQRAADRTRDRGRRRLRQRHLVGAAGCGCIRRRAAPTPTDARSSARGGDSSRAGGSSSARLASCAAMALTFAAYAAPPGWERPVAIVAVAALATVNWFGVTRTAQLTRVIVVVVLLVARRRRRRRRRRRPMRRAGSTPTPLWVGRLVRHPAGRRAAVLRVRGLRAHRHDGRGGARSRAHHPPRDRARARRRGRRLRGGRRRGAVDPRPRGDRGSRPSRSPTRSSAAGWGWAEPVVRDRRGRGIPRRAPRAHRGHRPHDVRDGARGRPPAVPRGGPPALAACRTAPRSPSRSIVIAIVAFADIRGAIGFSSFGVLLYYLVANLAAFRQRPDARRYPRALQVVGAVGCVILAVTLPWQSVVAGAAVVLVGVAYRAVRLRLTRAA